MEKRIAATRRCVAHVLVHSEAETADEEVQELFLCCCSSISEPTAASSTNCRAVDRHLYTHILQLLCLMHLKL